MDGADRCRRECAEGDLMNPDEMQFEADAEVERATSEPALVVDVEGFEGPLDLLLALAASRRSTSPKFRSWRSRISISPSSRRRASSDSSWRPTISSWRRGSPI